MSAIREWRSGSGRTVLSAVMVAALLMGFALLPHTGRASEAARLCRSAMATAAAESGVPEPVLAAIALTESGRSLDGRLQAWPWTINAGGKGHWFADRSSALRFAEDLLRAGRVSFDVGCFQINYRWHGAAFASLDAMFDPETNARYAARFLSDLGRETGDWSQAAGAYHSRTPELAARYRARFDTILAGLDGDMPAAPPVQAADAQPAGPGSGYDHPLLQAREAPRSPGSLVPLAPVPAT